jgi:hypothetical protein
MDRVMFYMLMNSRRVVPCTTLREHFHSQHT